MDDQKFQALMGLVGPSDMTSQQALAQQLRGQHDLGQLLSLSPTVGDFGRSMQQSALDTARTAGVRRAQGLDRARQAEQDRLAKQKYEDTLRGYSDTEWVTQDGQTFQIGTNKRTGQREIIPGTEGMQPHQKKYGTDTPKMINAPGLSDVRLGVYSDGRVLAPTGQVFSDYQSFAQAHPDLADEGLKNAIERERATEFASRRGEDMAEEVQEMITGASESMAAGGKAVGTLNDMVAAVDAGALSGPYTRYMPSWRDATILLDSAMAQLTLTGLTKHTLTPVSDRDLAYVKQSEAPDLSPSGLRRWALHKAEAIERMNRADQFMIDWYRENERVPTANDRKLLEPYLDEILHGGGFEFKFEPTPEEEIPDVEVAPVERPNWVNAADWERLTEEQKRQLAE